jgi:hypothetical protein
MSLTLNLIAWIAFMILIVGIPTYQLTSNILGTMAEQDKALEKKCDPLGGSETWTSQHSRSIAHLHDSPTCRYPH